MTGVSPSRTEAIYLHWPVTVVPWAVRAAIHDSGVEGMQPSARVSTQFYANFCRAARGAN